MTTEPGTPTLDQLKVFLSIVEAGSFAGAARSLGRATSVISYAISNLEAQLGVELFDRASRKPRLTQAGQTVLAEARTIARDLAGLRAKVKGLLSGLEAEIQLALDVMLPAARIVDALKAFREAFPTVGLRLHMEALGAVAQMVLQRRASLGVSGPLLDHPSLESLTRNACGDVRLVPVAGPGHPLAERRKLQPGEIGQHVQLVLTDRSPLTEGKDFSVISPRTWRLADLGAKHMLLREGIGWGNMPLPMVEEDLAAGRLVLLEPPDDTSHAYPFTAIHRTDQPPGPAGTWLIERFRNQPG